MRFKLIYKRLTRVGVFYIGQSHDGKFHPVFNDEGYGPYDFDWQAAEDLANNSTYSIAGAGDTSKLGIPEDLSEWERV